MKRVELALMLGILLVLAAEPANVWAWHAAGHELAARTAVAALPQDMPGFFRQGGETIAQQSLDPDLFRQPLAPELTIGEAPEHFFDLELLQDHPLPADRYAFTTLCAEMKINPKRIGLLPYAVTEWTQRLTVAFAEYRQCPDDPKIQARCLVYAGILSHYAADLCQPLHVTIHYDGRADAAGRSPRSGIHDKVDALPSRLALQDVRIAPESIHVIDKLLPGVMEELARSHALVERVYELEGELPPSSGPWRGSKAVTELTQERMQASAAFTASLFLTAWEQSAKVTLPKWAQ